jgi:hypothetical protein
MSRAIRFHFYAPAGEITIAAGGRPGGIISLPITFIAWGMGKIVIMGGLQNAVLDA